MKECTIVFRDSVEDKFIEMIKTSLESSDRFFFFGFSDIIKDGKEGRLGSMISAKVFTTEYVNIVMSMRQIVPHLVEMVEEMILIEAIEPNFQSVVIPELDRLKSEGISFVDMDERNLCDMIDTLLCKHYVEKKYCKYGETHGYVCVKEKEMIKNEES